MKTVRLFGLLTAVALSALAPAFVWAQGGPPGGGGGFNPSPEMRAGFEKMRKFRDENKQVFALGQTLRAFEEMDKDAKTKFTPAQAKTILAVANKWKAKPSITNEQATQINKDLTKPLTIPQIKALAAAASRRGGGGGGGFGGGQGGGGGRPGGGAPGGAGGGAWKMPVMKPFNPLNPATSPFARNKETAVRRMNEMLAMLAARAKGK